MIGDAVPDPATVVAAGRLLDALEDEAVGIVHAREDHAGSEVVVAVLLQNLTLEKEEEKTRGKGITNGFPRRS